MVKCSPKDLQPVLCDAKLHTGLMTLRMKYVNLERSRAGNSREAKKIGHRRFALLKDRWWNKRAEKLQRAGEEGNMQLQFRLIRELCGPTRRKLLRLSIPGTSAVTKSHGEIGFSQGTLSKFSRS